MNSMSDEGGGNKKEGVVWSCSEDRLFRGIIGKGL